MANRQEAAMGEAGVTAGMVVIGDEILSGRTRDSNIGTLAEFLTELGIDLCEVRVVADRREAIVDAVDALRVRYTHVFTTGGIGPTHDDITAESIAAAFGVDLYEEPEAVEMMRARYGEGALTETRRKMATVPRGSVLIANGATAAPGFTIGNVHVLAGVPEIMKAMLVELTPVLGKSHRLLSETIVVSVGEGVYAAGLAELQKRHPEVAMGSYPSITGEGFSAEIVLRSREKEKLEAAAGDVEAMLEELGVRTGDPAATRAP
jgi:molybdenum cofactor synthesis domain-containing protein